MLKKINKENTKFFHLNQGFGRQAIFKFLIWPLVIGLLIYSRFVNLGWGFPYPMHPDERNMAAAVQQLNCQLPIIELNLPKSLSENWDPVTSWLKIIKPFDPVNCFNPHFFAYGQFPLYLGYIVVIIMKFFDGDLGSAVSFQEAAFALRMISATASLLNFFVLFKILGLFLAEKIKDNSKVVLMSLLVIFAPYAIQFSHFGTTESLLMLFYILIVYFSFLLMENKIGVLPFVFNSAIILGLALSTKISSLVFLIVPFAALLFHKDKKFPIYYTVLTRFLDIFILGLITIMTFVIFSPHNFLNWQEFLGSMRYESDVAFGKTIVFYTRQFVDTAPGLFQMEKVFPYALGLPIFLTSLIGFVFLDWKNNKINLLRLAFIAYFLPTAIMFAKWTRFMAPVFPILTIIALLAISKIKDQISKISSKLKVLKFTLGFAFLIFLVVLMVPGINYLKIYQNSDVRFQATNWINNNIAPGSYVLSETANVVDIPLENLNNLNVISFNFYDLDENPLLQEELSGHLEKADYIFVPSRRIFANHLCEENHQLRTAYFESFFDNKCQMLKKTYPQLNKYYNDLFSGKIGFEKIAEFSSGLDDEQAEETWSVFDHPTIRIFKRSTKNPKI